MSSPAALPPKDAAGDSPPEVREKKLFEALSVELEQAIGQREKAFEELSAAKESSRKELESLCA